MTIEAILALIGGIALLVGILGGGVEAEKIKIPKVNALLRIVLALTGICLLLLAVFLSRPELLQVPPPAPQPLTPLPTDAAFPSEEATATTNPRTALYMYDDFEDPANDGAFDPEKWRLTGSSPDPKANQLNGNLTIVNAGDEPSGDVTLTASWYDGITLDVPMFIEADLALPPDSAPGAVDIGITASDPAMGTWLALCGIGRVGSQFTGNCTDFVWPEQTGHSFETPEQSFEPGSWHTFRIEVDPTSMTITYTIDGVVVGRHVPADAGPLGNAKFQFSLGTWKSSVNNPVTGSASYVHWPIWAMRGNQRPPLMDSRGHSQQTNQTHEQQSQPG